MDRSTLVEMQIDAGKQLLDQLVREEVPVAAAAWLKEADSGLWYLYVVTPLVGKDGATMEAYRQVLRVLRASPQPSWIDSMEIKAIGPTHPLARELLDVSGRFPGTNGGPMRWRGPTLDHLGIDANYPYAIPGSVSA